MTHNIFFGWKFEDLALVLNSIFISMATCFPVKLWDILEREDQTIIHWHLDGNSFKIEDLPRFEREIIPKYFRIRLKKAC